MASTLTSKFFLGVRKVPTSLHQLVQRGRANTFVADVFTAVGDATRLFKPRKHLPIERERERKQRLASTVADLRAAKLHKLSVDGRRLIELLKASEQITQ